MTKKKELLSEFKLSQLKALAKKKGLSMTLINDFRAKSKSSQFATCRCPHCSIKLVVERTQPYLFKKNIGSWKDARINKCPKCGEGIIIGNKKVVYIEALNADSSIKLKDVKDIIVPEKSQLKGKIGVRKIIEVLENEYHIEKPYTKEKEYERDLKHFCMGMFGKENVETQYWARKSRIDVKIGDIGIELKLLRSKADVHRLLGQVQDYQKIFGTRLIIIIVRSKIAYTHIKDLKKDLKAKKIKVIEKY